MSHFTVLVVGDDVEEKLDPFWELDLSQEEAEDDYRAEFVDETQKLIDEYEKNGTDMVETPEGLCYPWDEKFRVPGKFGFGNSTHNVPKHLKVRKVPFKELFESFDEFTEEWSGKEKNKHGKYGYYHNPKAKWDLYSIGGRWHDYFIHKEKPKYPEKIARGKRSLLDDSKEESHPRACDIVCKCDIDFKEIEKNARHKAERYWEEAKKLDDSDKDFIYGIKEGMSKSEYVMKHASEARKITPYAVVLDDGSWIEKGTMGWWGFSSDENSDWNKDFQKIFDSLPDDAVLTIVDCHI